MTIFRLEFSSNQAILTVNIPTESGAFKKKSLRAGDAESLWAGLKALDGIRFLEPEQQAEVYAAISKATEREFIQVALERFLASGGRIRKVVGKKLKMSKEEESEILDILNDIDLSDIAA